MSQLGKVEDEIFKTRQQKELDFKARNKAKKRRMDYQNQPFNRDRPNWSLLNNTQFEPTVSMIIICRKQVLHTTHVCN